MTEASRTFSLIERRPWGRVVAVLGGIVAIETVLVHVLVSRWSPIAAIAASGLSIAALAWIVRDWLLLRRVPIVVDEDGLDLRVGVRLRARIQWAAIEEARVVNGPPEGYAYRRRGVPPPPPLLDVSTMGGNVLVRFRDTVRLAGPVGLELRAKLLLLTVDEPDDLVRAIDDRLARTGSRDRGRTL